MPRPDEGLGSDADLEGDDVSEDEDVGVAGLDRDGVFEEGDSLAWMLFRRTTSLVTTFPSMHFKSKSPSPGRVKFALDFS